LWIEAKLDTLEPGYRAPGTLGALAAFGKIVADGVNAVKESKTPGTGDPEWIAPPERAGYEPLLPHGERVAVALDNGVEDWLERVHSAASYRLGDTVTIKIWLGWAEEPGVADRSVAVAIGAQRVGTLAATPPFADLMADAAKLDELPTTLGHLTKRAMSPRFLLEASTPVNPASPSTRNEPRRQRP
jgi:hypothetical protein